MDNPFSTRHIRPGAIPFLFPPGDSATQVIDRLRANHWWGEIIGPHGSGKSTLLCALIPEIHRAGRGTLLIELHDGQRRLGVDLGREVGRKLDSVVIVDGYEQLALVNRWRLKRFCRRQGQGLVVTSHRTAGLPLVFRTEATPRLAEEIVRRLLQGLPATVDAAELERIFLRHRGNLREVLFELYDWYEQREAR